ncbi:glycoside hydrolase [Clostridium isatidis]|uniref:Glycoside hydrolase n=1 Tax=Clostridium isatidis TaxID=182773 RepID=A0A343JEH2_9CLOT|nr:glycoside hydrolase [Clostridium isatidis]ASW43930.1 glycoside hydrolase [Clostridium isatidis]
MKLSVLGGGGVRAPFLIKTLVTNAKSLNIDEICLMDINQKKLKIFGQLAIEIGNKIDSNLNIYVTSDKVKALKDADFIITTLRVGGDEGRYFDEKLAQKYEVLGQETTGIGGFAMALRSIPAIKEYLDLARQVSKPNVKIFNFTNPSGLVTQALINDGYTNIYGICDGPSSFIRQLAEMMNTDLKEFDVTCYGLNHLSFYRDFKINGRDATKEVLEHVNLFKDTEMKVFDKEIVPLLNYELPNEYLYFFFYNNNVIEAISRTGFARGELIKNINEKMIKELELMEEENLEKRFSVYIKYLMERENSYFSIESNGKRNIKHKEVSLQEFLDAPDKGGYAGVALNIIRGLQGKDAIPMTILVKNNGYIKELKDDDVIEITCDMENGEIKARTIDNIPEVQMNYIKSIKLFERLTAEAIKEKNKEKAIRALMVHPLINSYTRAKSLLEELLAQYKEYTGEWK